MDLSGQLHPSKVPVILTQRTEQCPGPCGLPSSLAGRGRAANTGWAQVPWMVLAEVSTQEL